MKYRNVSGFRQLVIINGKKELVNKNNVIETDRELLQPGFEAVSDDIPVSETSQLKRKIIRSDAFLEINQKIEDLQNDTKATSQMAETQELAAVLANQVEELKQKTNDIDLRDDIMSLREDITELKAHNKKIDEDNIVIKKRLEILKGVAQTLEYQVELLVGDDEELETQPESFRKT